MGFIFAENVTDDRCEALKDGSEMTRYRWRTQLLPYICPLVARKFDVETASIMLNMLTQASSSALALPPAWPKIQPSMLVVVLMDAYRVCCCEPGPQLAHVSLRPDFVTIIDVEAHAGIRSSRLLSFDCHCP